MMPESALRKQKLLARLDKLDAMLDKLIADLQTQDTALLKRQPAPGKWSVLQIMHHLIRAERGSLGYVRKKMSFQPKYTKKSVSTALRSWTLNMSLVLPLKYKSPAVADTMDLPSNTTLNETVFLWRSVRRELRGFIEGFDDGLLDLEVYKHPYAGRMTLAHMLVFFEKHYRRHQRQIQRILSRSKP